MREMEIDMTNPTTPVLWVKGKKIEFHGWKKYKPRDLIRKVNIYGGHKQAAKDFYRTYGVTASVACKFYNNGLTKMTLGAMEGHEELCYRRRRFHSGMTINACLMKDELDQAVKDGIRNITPFISHFGMNPQELKKHLGNSVWKALCKNTFSRNRVICEALVYPTDRRELHFVMNMPTGILRVDALAREMESFNYLHKKAGITIKDLAKQTKAARDAKNILFDAVHMAQRYGVPFSYEWSWRRVKELHEQLIHEVNRREALRLAEQQEKYKRVLREGKNKIWTYGGVVGKFLDTYESILNEGSQMRHCVGGYAASCYENHYAVFHLSGDGEESTLGVYIHKNLTTGFDNYSFSQHYLAGNESVTSDRHKLLAKMIIDDLNTEASVMVTIDLDKTRAEKVVNDWIYEGE